MRKPAQSKMDRLDRAYRNYMDIRKKIIQEYKVSDSYLNAYLSAGDKIKGRDQ